jgi:hypothetical protein
MVLRIRREVEDEGHRRFNEALLLDAVALHVSRAMHHLFDARRAFY